MFDTTVVEDPTLWRQQAADGYYWPLAEMIRKASQSDQSADLAGEPGVDRVALLDAFQRAERHLREQIDHACTWNNDDRCNTCGADGRA